MSVGLPSSANLRKSGVMLMAGASVQAVVGFVSQLVLMRHLAPEIYGAFAMSLAGLGLAQTVLSLRIEAMIIRTDEAEMTDERRGLFHAAILWESGAMALSMLGWLIAADLLSPLSLILAAAMVANHWTSQTTAFAERRMPYRLLTIAETGSQIFGHLLAMVLALLGAGAASLYWRELSAVALRLAILRHAGVIEAGRFRVLSWAEWRTLIRDGRDIWFDGVVDGGFSRVMVLSAGWVGGLAGAGLFFQAHRLASVPQQLLGPVTSRLAANVFSRLSDPASRRRVLIRLLLSAGAPVITLAVAAMLFANPVVPLLFGDHWSPAAGLLGAMAGVIVFNTGFELLRVYCLTQRRLGEVVRGRAAQYLAFGVGILAATTSSDPIQTLGLALSASFTAAFLTMAFRLRRG